MADRCCTSHRDSCGRFADLCSSVLSGLSQLKDADLAKLLDGVKSVAPAGVGLELAASNNALRDDSIALLASSGLPLRSLDLSVNSIFSIAPLLAKPQPHLVALILDSNHLGGQSLVC